MSEPMGGTRHSVCDFLRGFAFPELANASPYRRLDGARLFRAPRDIFADLEIPAGLRLELEGTARSVRISYTTLSDRGAPWDDKVGRDFEVWGDGESLSQSCAVVGSGTVELGLAPHCSKSTIYLPERLRPTITEIGAIGSGAIWPYPVQPKWLAYGDSITQGWVASSPSRTWTALVGRAAGWNVCNLGLAGAARGEIVIAEQIALAPETAFISLAFGTNSWSIVPSTTDMMRAQLEGFLLAIRMRQPSLPILVISPIIRPLAEGTPNGLGATQAELRQTIESTVERCIARGDQQLYLLPGYRLVDEKHLPDGVHPNDAGHRQMAEAVLAALSSIRVGLD